MTARGPVPAQRQLARVRTEIPSMVETCAVVSRTGTGAGLVAALMAATAGGLVVMDLMCAVR